MVVSDELANSKSPTCTPDRLDHLLRELARVRKHMLEQADGLEPQIRLVFPAYRESALNLAHYLGLRQRDLRSVQEALAEVGLSSLGRCEAHALASVDAVLWAGHALKGEGWTDHGAVAPPIGSAAAGRARLAAHTAALLGREPDERQVRIMVTLPTEASVDYKLVHDLVGSGMDCARINCAHDDPAVWQAMAAHVRRASAEMGRPCRILVDLAGPKLRTGALPPGPAVVRWRIKRDPTGDVLEPARIWLTSAEHPPPAPGSADASLPLAAEWLAQLSARDQLKFHDLRRRQRRLLVTEVRPDGCWAEASQGARVSTNTRLRIARRAHGPQPAQLESALAGLPPTPGAVMVQPGDTILLIPGSISGEARGTHEGPARIPCSLPSNLSGIHAGDPIWFDDGKIGGRIRSIGHDELEVVITHAKTSGSKLRADRSINLPQSELDRPPLLPKDLEDLPFVAEYADMVGLSFAENPAGVEQLADALHDRTTRSIGIVLKIETRRGFERLPQLLLAAMRQYPVGVMIARGDLAVECGYERLAEVQEEMLWLCEAAHLPVIWATQVLDQLTRTGQPSRAEVTDAAMAERAECVMLNKGPYVVEAVRALDNILRRMQAHQHKKQSLFRKLHVSELG